MPGSSPDCSARRPPRGWAEAVLAVAARRGLPPAQVALAWLLGRRGVTAPLVGATSKQHVDDAAGALAVRLDDQEVARLEASYLPWLLSNFG